MDTLGEIKYVVAALSRASSQKLSWGLATEKSATALQNLLVAATSCSVKTSRKVKSPRKAELATTLATRLATTSFGGYQSPDSILS